jgi:hypothetical protein
MSASRRTSLDILPLPEGRGFPLLASHALEGDEADATSLIQSGGYLSASQKNSDPEPEQTMF